MTRGTFTSADGCKLEFEVSGEGPPVLWQHGLGAPISQPAAVFPSDQGLKRITLACRGHESSDLGSFDRLSIANFTDDARALLDHLGIETAAVGGISLGAGIGLHLAAFRPERVSRLILARPAWVDRPSLATQKIYHQVAETIEKRGLVDGLKHFQVRREFLDLKSASPDNAASALSYFNRPRPETTIALLSTIPLGFPGVPREMIEAIGMPTLIIGNAEDIVHPLAFARELNELIPASKLEIITSKTVDPQAYLREFRIALTNFLTGAEL